MQISCSDFDLLLDSAAGIIQLVDFPIPLQRASTFAIIPPLLGFFTKSVASFLSPFNKDVGND